MKVLVALAAVLAVYHPGSPLRAQPGALAGSVRLAGSQAPAIGAAVTIVGTPFSALTDSAGRFSIGAVTPGAYYVEARRIGARPSRVATVIEAGKTAAVTITLAERAVELVGVEVVGVRPEARGRFPGAVALVSAEEIAAQQPLSANDVLRTLPGVHVQEEEGAGLRANIGVRGLDPDRSRTVLVLEDGVPVALGPYGEPEMYYSPPIDRMERVEVIKGSGSVLFGPQTIGGVVNYVTAAPPAEATWRLEARGGTGGSRLTKLRFGGTWDRVRASAVAFEKRADDWNGAFYGVRDATGKVGARFGRHDLGLKASVYDERSNATYVGLTDSIFRESPHVHPAPDDRLWIRRYALTGTHESAWGPTVVRTNLYGYRTSRNWRRQDYTYTGTGNSYAFSNSAGHRNRSFDVVGVEPRLRTTWSVRELTSELEAGVRGHLEWARDRFLVGDSPTATTGTLRDDEERFGIAFAAFAQNRFFLAPSLAVTAGLRFERFDFTRHLLRTRVRRQVGSIVTRNPEDVSIERSDGMAELMPGLGVSWNPSVALSLFAGAHRGFAPPRTKDAFVFPDSVVPTGGQPAELVSLELEAERSWNYELGARLTPAAAVTIEATLFHLDFSNQIIEPSLSSGAVSQAQLANQGATRHSGLELSARVDAGRLLARPYSLVLSGGYTLVDARFSKERFLVSPSRDTVSVKGNRLPYAPRHKANASLVFEHPRGLQLRVDGTLVGAQFADNFETVRGSANGRAGKIPAYHVFDLSARYRLPRLHGVTLVGTVKNLTDATYVASRRPEGIKAGLGRVTSGGLIWEF